MSINNINKPKITAKERIFQLMKENHQLKHEIYLLKNDSTLKDRIIELELLIDSLCKTETMLLKELEEKDEILAQHQTKKRKLDTEEEEVSKENHL